MREAFNEGAFNEGGIQRGVAHPEQLRHTREIRMLVPNERRVQLHRACGLCGRHQRRRRRRAPHRACSANGDTARRE